MALVTLFAFGMQADLAVGQERGPLGLGFRLCLVGGGEMPSLRTDAGEGTAGVTLDYALWRSGRLELLLNTSLPPGAYLLSSLGIRAELPWRHVRPYLSAGLGSWVADRRGLDSGASVGAGFAVVALEPQGRVGVFSEMRFWFLSGGWYLVEAAAVGVRLYL